MPELGSENNVLEERLEETYGDPADASHEIKIVRLQARRHWHGNLSLNFKLKAGGTWIVVTVPPKTKQATDSLRLVFVLQAVPQGPAL